MSGLVVLGGLLLLVALAVGVVWLVWRSVRRTSTHDAQQYAQALPAWLATQGLQVADPATAVFPEALRANALVPRSCVVSAAGPIGGRPGAFQLWSGDYQERTSPWQYGHHFHVVAVEARAALPLAALAAPEQIRWIQMYLPVPLLQAPVQSWSGLSTWGLDDALRARLGPLAQLVRAQRGWLVLAPGLVAVVGDDRADVAQLEARTRLAGAVAAALG